MSIGKTKTRQFSSCLEWTKEPATVMFGIILQRDSSTVLYRVITSVELLGRSKHTGSLAQCYKPAGLGRSNDWVGTILSSIFM